MKRVVKKEIERDVEKEKERKGEREREREREREEESERGRADCARQTEKDKLRKINGSLVENKGC